MLFDGGLPAINGLFPCGAMVDRPAFLPSLRIVLSNGWGLLLVMAQRPKFYTNQTSAQYGTRRQRWDGRSAYNNSRDTNRGRGWSPSIRISSGRTVNRATLSSLTLPHTLGLAVIPPSFLPFVSWLTSFLVALSRMLQVPSSPNTEISGMFPLLTLTDNNFHELFTCRERFVNGGGGCSDFGGDCLTEVGKRGGVDAWGGGEEGRSRRSNEKDDGRRCLGKFPAYTYRAYILTQDRQPCRSWGCVAWQRTASPFLHIRNVGYWSLALRQPPS